MGFASSGCFVVCRVGWMRWLAVFCVFAWGWYNTDACCFGSWVLAALGVAVVGFGMCGFGGFGVFSGLGVGCSEASCFCRVWLLLVGWWLEVGLVLRLGLRVWV